MREVVCVLVCFPCAYHKAKIITVKLKIVIDAGNFRRIVTLQAATGKRENTMKRTAPPAEFFEVKMWFTFPERSLCGWGSLTNGFANRDDAWEAFSEKYDGDNRGQFLVVKIDTAEGTARDLTEDWCDTWDEEHGEPLDWSSHDYHDRFANPTRACEV
jgi:hypothetical protein